jgi:exodeoxyribonuclease VII large subunit
VARAIATSAIPVMSAVGHEVDFTIADFVADVRAPTPSAAAEMVVRQKEDFLDRVAALERRLASSARYRLRDLRSRVERISTHQAFAAVLHGIETRGQRVDESVHRARFHLDRRLTRLGQRLQGLSTRLSERRVDRRLGEARTRLALLSARLEAAERKRLHGARRGFAEVASKLGVLSPLGVLGRGYSLAWSPQGKLLRSADEVAVGDAVRVDLARGRLHCRVEKRDD